LLKKEFNIEIQEKIMKLKGEKNLIVFSTNGNILLLYFKILEFKLLFLIIKKVIIVMFISLPSAA
jgi:hypothetical protein